MKKDRRDEQTFTSANARMPTSTSATATASNIAIAIAIASASASDLRHLIWAHHIRQPTSTHDLPKLTSADHPAQADLQLART